jgi:hypothetical protein
MGNACGVQVCFAAAHPLAQQPSLGLDSIGRRGVDLNAHR